jgi:D-3-phosphoglycerate dehydrogenase
MEFKIGITDYIQPPFDFESQAFPNADFLFLDSTEEGNFCPNTLSELDALIVWHAEIGELTAKRLSKAKIVVRYGVGFDNIDIQGLNKFKIKFCNTPDYGTEEVADTASAMILNLQRKICSYDFACRTYSTGWQENIQPPIQRTNTQTLGVIGVGRIGTALISRMRPFGYRILGFDPYQPSGHEKAIGYHREHEISEILAKSDIISLHCPLSTETQGMVDNHFISKMKPGAILVNTGRGNVISDFDCVHHHLRSGQLGAAAFDVLPIEPPPMNHSLIKAWRNNDEWIAGRLIINPHTSYYSEQAVFEMRYKAAETARIFLEKGILRNQVQ